MIADHPYDEYNTLLVLVTTSTTILTSFITHFLLYTNSILYLYQTQIKVNTCFERM